MLLLFVNSCLMCIVEVDGLVIILGMDVKIVMVVERFGICAVVL